MVALEQLLRFREGPRRLFWRRAAERPTNVDEIARAQDAREILARVYGSVRLRYWRHTAASTLCRSADGFSTNVCSST